MFHWKSVCPLVIWALAATVATVQAQTANWSGVVSDPQALPLPGASVELRMTDGNFVTGVTTDREGGFQLSVTPGSYQFRASLLGFETLAQDVTIGPSGGSLNVRLEIGSFVQEVVVSATIRATTTRTGTTTSFRATTSRSTPAGPSASSRTLRPRSNTWAGTRSNETSTTLDGFSTRRSSRRTRTPAR